MTAIFAHFYGLDELIKKVGKDEPDIILAVIDVYYRIMAQVIEQFGGTISRVDSYQSGHRILALFGALRAHENDHLRAVHTASLMNERLSEVNALAQEIVQDRTDVRIKIGQRIGINSGFVFGSDVGAEFRREYTIMGDQVNLTARLMSIAEPGAILIGENTAKRLEAHFVLDEKPPIKVKGKTGQIKSYALEKILQKDSTFSENASPMIGRQIELAMGTECIDEVAGGIFKTLIVRGDSGIGKTRLSQEVISYAVNNNFSFLSSHSQSFRKNMPFNTWIRVFNNIFGINSTQESGESDRADRRVAPSPRAGWRSSSPTPKSCPLTTPTCGGWPGRSR